MKVKEFLKSFAGGTAMGVASAIPGVSGGTVAVIIGIYDKLINAISSLFKNFIKSVLTLIPILLGVACALIPCFFLFDFAFQYFAFGIVSLFAGLTIGSFPGILDEVKGSKLTTNRIIVTIITFIIPVGLGVGSALLHFDVSSLMSEPTWWFYLLLIPVGAIAAVALIVPGISGSMIMLVLGFYKPILELITGLLKNIGGPNFVQGVIEVMLFAVGAVLGVLTIAKLMNHLLNKSRVSTFYGIIGFILGSLIAIFFNHEIYSYYQTWGVNTLPIWLEVILGFCLLVGGIFASYQFVKYSRKHNIKQ